MGSLVPGTPYIYERVGDTVFRREAGSLEREVVGYDHRTSDGRPLHQRILEDKMWGDIRRAACTNPTLQDALDRAIMIYNLSRTNE
jgi:rhamnogalacturonyl hydrolase YesR